MPLLRPLVGFWGWTVQRGGSRQEQHPPPPTPTLWPALRCTVACCRSFLRAALW